MSLNYDLNIRPTINYLDNRKNLKLYYLKCKIVLIFILFILELGENEFSYY